MKLQPKSKFIILVFLICLITGRIISQDLFNLKNSTAYASYLFKSNEYKLAAREYERIIFMDPTNKDSKLFLIKSYNLAGEYDLAIKRFKYLYPSFQTAPPEISYEFGKLLIKNNLLDESGTFLAQSDSLNESDKLILQASTEMFRGNWDAANILIDALNKDQHPVLNNYRELTTEINNQKYKNQYLSMGLSAIIPGLGKVYSGYWKDGLIAFLFVTVSGWQSYRGFDKQGINSLYGWIYGLVGTGFYMGNIYGSGKAANKYNDTKEHYYKHKVEDIFNNIR